MAVGRRLGWKQNIHTNIKSKNNQKDISPLMKIHSLYNQDSAVFLSFFFFFGRENKVATSRRLWSNMQIYKRFRWRQGLLSFTAWESMRFPWHKGDRLKDLIHVYICLIKIISKLSTKHAFKFSSRNTFKRKSKQRNPCDALVNYFFKVTKKSEAWNT